MFAAAPDSNPLPAVEASLVLLHSRGSESFQPYRRLLLWYHDALERNLQTQMLPAERGLVLTYRSLCVNLFHEVKHDGDGDEERCAAADYQDILLLTASFALYLAWYTLYSHSGFSRGSARNGGEYHLR